MQPSEWSPPRGIVSQSADVIRLSSRRESITRSARALYRLLQRQGDISLAALLTWARLPSDQTQSALDELADLGLIVVRDGQVTAIPYASAVDSLLAVQSRALGHALETVQEAQRRLLVLIGGGAALSGDSTGTVLAAVPVPEDDARNPFHAAELRPAGDLAAMHPGARFSEELLENSLKRAEARLADGGRLRVIHQAAAMSHPRSVAYFQRIEQLGGQVRLRENLPFRLLLTEGREAVCHLAWQDSLAETLLIQGPHMLDLLGRVFEASWIDAAPLGDFAREPRLAAELGYAGSVPVLSSQQQAIMRYLADGATDQAIARFLGITPRTVTRRVTEIYQALGVQSRFQAGAMARRMGLV